MKNKQKIEEQILNEKKELNKIIEKTSIELSMIEAPPSKHELLLEACKSKDSHLKVTVDEILYNRDYDLIMFKLTTMYNTQDKGEVMEYINKYISEGQSEYYNEKGRLEYIINECKSRINKLNDGLNTINEAEAVKLKNEQIEAELKNKIDSLLK